MRFGIYGHDDVDIERREGRWVIYRRGLDTRREDHAVFVPADLHENDLATYLDDLLHDEAVPGRSIRRIG